MIEMVAPTAKHIPGQMSSVSGYIVLYMNEPRIPVTLTNAPSTANTRP